MKELKEKLTIAIKTFERPGCLQECVESIKKMYPDIKIIVADDSKNPEKNELVDEYYFLPHDSGLSYGRNFLMSKISTPYCMMIDDDTKFVTPNCIDMMVSILDNNPGIDLVAGHILGNIFKGILEKDDDTLYKIIGKHKETINNHKIYDFVINLFIAKTDKIKKILWNNDLKICEHINFFYRAKDTIKSTVCHDAVFLNSSKTNPTYYKFRTQRVAEYTQKQCESLNVKKIQEKHER